MNNDRQHLEQGVVDANPSVISWQKLLKEQTVTCPKCGAAWLVLRPNQQVPHICKACGHQFKVVDSSI